MMRSLVLAAVFMAAAVPARAAIDAGFAIGQQRYPGYDDHDKVVSDLDILFRGQRFGLHAVGEYADLTTVDGPLIAVHPDLVYRVPAGKFRWMFGAGPSFIRVGSTVTETTWNGEAELARAVGKTDLFARVRFYDFSISDTRAGEAGPNGPVISIGVRFRLTD